MAQEVSDVIVEGPEQDEVYELYGDEEMMEDIVVDEEEQDEDEAAALHEAIEISDSTGCAYTLQCPPATCRACMSQEMESLRLKDPPKNARDVFNSRRPEETRLGRVARTEQSPLHRSHATIMPSHPSH